jgi:hypothetical protein
MPFFGRGTPGPSDVATRTRRQIGELGQTEPNLRPAIDLSKRREEHAKLLVGRARAVVFDSQGSCGTYDTRDDPNRCHGFRRCHEFRHSRKRLLSQPHIKLHRRLFTAEIELDGQVEPGNRICHQIVEGKSPCPTRFVGGKGRKLAHELPTFVGCIPEFAYVLRERVGVRCILFCEMRVADDHPEYVIDFVNDAGRKVPDRPHPLRMQDASSCWL